MSQLTTLSIAIDLDDDPNKAWYDAKVTGRAQEAEQTLSNATGRPMIADHTSIPEGFRGLGVAQALAERLIEVARNNGQRILQICPFVRAHTVKNKEALVDVIKW